MLDVESDLGSNLKLSISSNKSDLGLGLKFNPPPDGTTDDGTDDVQFWAVIYRSYLYTRFGTYLFLLGTYPIWNGTRWYHTVDK